MRVVGHVLEVGEARGVDDGAALLRVKGVARGAVLAALLPVVVEADILRGGGRGGRGKGVGVGVRARAGAGAAPSARLTHRVAQVLERRGHAVDRARLVEHARHDVHDDLLVDVAAVEVPCRAAGWDGGSEGRGLARGRRGGGAEGAHAHERQPSGGVTLRPLSSAAMPPMEASTIEDLIVHTDLTQI